MSNRWIATAALVTFSAIAAAAQDKPAPQPQEKPQSAPSAAPREAPARVPLRVTFVLSRSQGDKKISSLPYVLGVTANGQQTTLRMGLEVPISTTVFKSSGEKQDPVRSYSYRNVGTNIDCRAHTPPGVGPGTFELLVTVSDTHAGLDAGAKQRGTSPIVEDMPTFRSFSSSFAILLRDGQTTQYTSATDPVTGEVMKIDITLNVLK